MTTSTSEAPPRRSRAGGVALVLGIVAVVASIIPFLSYIAWAVGIAAVVVGIVALAKQMAKRGPAIAGLILGVVAIVLSIVLSVVYTTVFFLAVVSSSLATITPDSSAGPTPRSLATESAASGDRVVTYRVTGGGRATSITYATADASGAGSDQVSNVKLPWTKRLPVADPAAFTSDVFTLVAQRGSGGGRITCEIEADGKVISKHSSSGEYATVTCSGTTD